MNADQYVNLITSQHRNAPKFVAWVRFLVSLFDTNIGSETIASYDLKTAQGNQLNTVGTLAGIKRNVLGDETPLNDTMYRRVIRAKIVKNQFSGQQGSLSDIWTTVFGSDLGIEVRDNQDMTMSIDLTGSDYSAEMMGLLLGGYIVPKPLGVGISYSLSTNFPDTALNSGCFVSASGLLEIPSGDEKNTFYSLLGTGTEFSVGGTSEFISADA